jgi:hypothetical protein
MMTKFQWGNMKNARYLDHESLTMFYPIILKQFALLTDHLLKEGHPDLAKNALKRYDDVMPDLYPYTEVAARKFYLLEDAFKAGDAQLAVKWANQIDDYLTNILNYNADMVQNNQDQVNTRDVQLSMSVLNGMNNLAKEYHQAALNAKFDKQLKDYETRLGSLLSRQQ